jgi:hypothetical protein
VQNSLGSALVEVMQQSDWNVPNEYSDRRVRILAEVVNQPDEITLVIAMLQRNGCRVRPLSKDKVPFVGGDTTELSIDMWLDGNQRLAVREATRRVEDLAERAKLGLWVRDAALIDYPRSKRVTYYVSNVSQRQGWGAVLGVLQSWITRMGPRRLVQVQEGTPESTVHAEFARHGFGQPLDHVRHSIHPMIEPISPQLSMKQRLLGVAILLASMLSVNAVIWASGFWALFPILLAIATGVSLLVLLRPKSAVGWFECIAIWAAAAGIGVITGLRFGDNPLRLLGGLCLAWVGITVASGIVFAIRGSWLARNVVWAVPLTITLLAPTVPWLGGLFLAEYLSQFGIPDSAVSISTMWKVIVATGPILAGAVVVLIYLGLIGWLRYFHVIHRYNRSFISFTVVVVVLVYALTSIQFGLTNADSAAKQAQAAVRDGRNPASYNGLQGTLVCVEPLHTPVAILYGPLPSSRPVLSFSPNGDRLWVWDPGPTNARDHGGRTVGVQLQDVTVVQALGQPAACRFKTH